MIGTRKWISRVEQTLELPVNSDNINVQYLEKLLEQGKKISQIISFIWLNEDSTTARILDGYFKRGDNEELTELLFANNVETEEYNLLLNIFSPEHLPIFAQEDRFFINFRVVTDKFEGNISDPGPSDDSVFTMTIPYPPRPEISDDVNDSGDIEIIDEYTTIKKSELQEWLNQNSDEPPYFYENNPYIPTSSS